MIYAKKKEIQKLILVLLFVFQPMLNFYVNVWVFVWKRKTISIKDDKTLMGTLEIPLKEIYLFKSDSGLRFIFIFVAFVLWFWPEKRNKI